MGRDPLFPMGTKGSLKSSDKFQKRGSEIIVKKRGGMKFVRGLLTFEGILTVIKIILKNKVITISS